MDASLEGTAPAIEVANLRRVYSERKVLGRGRETVALDGISFSVAYGSVFGLLGNPAGDRRIIILTWRNTVRQAHHPIQARTKPAPQKFRRPGNHGGSHGQRRARCNAATKVEGIEDDIR